MNNISIPEFNRPIYGNTVGVEPDSRTTNTSNELPGSFTMSRAQISALLSVRSVSNNFDTALSAKLPVQLNSEEPVLITLSPHQVKILRQIKNNQ